MALCQALSQHHQPVPWVFEEDTKKVCSEAVGNYAMTDVNELTPMRKKTKVQPQRLKCSIKPLKRDKCKPVSVLKFPGS